VATPYRSEECKEDRNHHYQQRDEQQRGKGAPRKDPAQTAGAAICIVPRLEPCATHHSDRGQDQGDHDKKRRPSRCWWRCQRHASSRYGGALTLRL
jgi:hypothetical protein